MVHHTDFDAIAFAYDHLKRLVFGTALDKAQIALIPYIPSQARILIIGGGTGQIITDILERKTVEQITYVELSAQMLQAAEKRVRSRKVNNVQFFRGAADLLKERSAFDVIITPFVLDLYREHELMELMQPLDALLVPDGKWLCCDFQITTKSTWTKLWQKCLMTSMYCFFALTSQLKARRIPNYGHAFQRLGYKPVVSHSFYASLIHSWVLMKVQ